VLFAELRGLTRLCSQLEPQRLIVLLEGFMATMADVAVAHQALIDRLIGDALMLLYGVPRPRRDDASRAVRTALAMQHAFLGLRNQWIAQGRSEVKQLGLRIGVASGNLVMAEVEPAGPAAVGEVVTRAARLCAAAGLGKVLIDQKTYELTTRASKATMDFTAIDVSAGRRDPIPAYRCTRRRSGLRLVARRLYQDPVCQTSVDPRSSVRRKVDGKVHYFCSRSCADRFTDDPGYFTRRVIGD